MKEEKVWYISNLKPITISSGELRDRVEEHLDRLVHDSVWKRAEAYARMKLESRKRENPETYNNGYLVLLTADTVREIEFSDLTVMDCEAKLVADRRIRKEPT